MFIYSDKTGKFEEEKKEIDMYFCSFFDAYGKFINDVALFGNFPSQCPIHAVSIKIIIFNSNLKGVLAIGLVYFNLRIRLHLVQTNCVWIFT